MPVFKNPASRKRNYREGGFTLIEVMAASVILGMTVAAVVFMILNSSALRVANDHNRQARAIVLEELEDPQHHFLMYVGMGGLANAHIFLDNAEPGQVGTDAVRTLTVTPLTAAPYAGVSTQYQLLRSTITWSENGRNTNVTLYKRIVNTK